VPAPTVCPAPVTTVPPPPSLTPLPAAGSERAPRRHRAGPGRLKGASEEVR
jgi:hypothetical protein